ncbi:metallophosphoesterase family protein [Microbulbifer agarilyticus]
MPENGPDNALLAKTVYYFDYQGTRFTSLNSQPLSVDSEEAALQQRGWLEQVLSDNPNRWTVIFHHHPMTPATKRRIPHDGLSEHFKPLYEKFNVDLVLQGHDHSYTRGENLSCGGTWLGQQSPVYVVSVSGPEMYGGGAS